MKKNQKLRKGFTLVELVIVIAVIAILAVVLIPTFGSIIRKAQETKALQEVTSAYKATLADDILNGTTIVHGHQYDIIVWYDEYKLYVIIDADGKASISYKLETGKSTTHSLVDGKLKPGHVHKYVAAITSPTCTEKGFTTYTCSEPNCDNKTYIGNEVDANGHKFDEYGYSDGKHYKRCWVCLLTVPTDDHTYVTDENTGKVKCECGEEKLFEFKCFTAYECDCPHKWTMAQLKNLTSTKCEVSGHNSEHYVCPEPGCGGCLVETCAHNFDEYISLDNESHAARCTECHELIESNHERRNGTCIHCGNHVHIDKDYIYNDENTHLVTCYYCDAAPTKPHTLTITSKNAAGHTGTCSQCNATVALAHTDGVDCATCNFKFCSHPNATYVDLGNGTHQWTCNGVPGATQAAINCHIGTKAPEAHILDENGKCTLCPYNPVCHHTGVKGTLTGAFCDECDSYIYDFNDNTVINSYTKNYLKNGYDCIIYFSNKDASLPKSVAAFQIGMNASNTVKSVTLDLQGGTLKLTGAITNYVKNLTIRNGTIETSSYIATNVAANITLENVTITKTSIGNGLITGQTGTNIKIIKSTIDISGATNKRVAYFHAESINSVSIEIADSEIICGDGHLVYFQKSGQTNNSIAVTNTTVNGVELKNADDVKEYIYKVDGELPNITAEYSVQPQEP